MTESGSIIKKPFTTNLNSELIQKIKKIAKQNKISTSELVNRVLFNFISNFEDLRAKKKESKTKPTEQEEKNYLEYLDSVMKTLTDSSVSKKSKDFMIGK